MEIPYELLSHVSTTSIFYKKEHWIANLETLVSSATVVRHIGRFMVLFLLKQTNKSRRRRNNTKDK